MGILNLSPESFSGDGAAEVMDAKLRFAALVEAGADMIDIGAESTRPNATPLTEAEEWTRLEPVLSVIADHPLRARVQVSIDSYHATTTAKSLALGVDIINDVSGLRSDAMLQVAAQCANPIIVMHALTIPADPAITWEEGVDAVKEILHWKHAIQLRAAQGDIDVNRLIYDPGIGFGKTAEQSLQLVQRAGDLVKSGGRWLFGHSRKSFLQLVSDTPAHTRDEATIAVSRQLAGAGVQWLRVHNVAAHRQALK
jgi:dihydropteroate synthase